MKIMPQQRWRQGTQKSKGKVCPEVGNPKAFRTAKENYAKPCHKAWPRKRRRKLCQGGGRDRAPRKVEENYAKSVDKAWLTKKK